MFYNFGNIDLHARLRVRKEEEEEETKIPYGS